MTLAGIAVLSFAAAVLSALLVSLSIRYAHRRALIDVPGQRRSHAVPTPRGGGVGIVFAILLCAFVPLLRESPLLVGTAALSFAAVALVGWIDDHRPLSARVRFATHLAAAIAVVSAAEAVGLQVPVAFFAFAALAIAWSINLHNFMDGINGILGLQAAFVFGTLAAFAVEARHLDVATIAAVACAATLAFLPFNLPRAKVFMGDVGSGALGFLIGVSLLFAVHRGTVSAWSAALLASAFVVDATATLASRAVRGKRWWKPHREHLYQWLHRAGMSHLGVDLRYLAWNLVVVLPAVFAIERTHASRYACILAPAAYVAAAALWSWGKRASIRRVKT